MLRRNVMTVLILCLLVAGIVPGGSPAAQDNVAKFGASLALTGKFAREGLISKQAYDMWRDAVNAAGGLNVGGQKYKVDIKYYDDQSDNTTATRLVERLITVDGINFILAPYGSGAVFAASSVTEKYEVPMVSGQAAADNIFSRGYKYIFSTMANTRDYQRSAFDVATTLKPRPKRVAVVWVNALFGEAVARSVRGFTKQHGMEIVLDEKFDVGIKDFTPLLTKLQGAKVDMLSLIGYPAETTLLMRQMDESRLNIPLVSVAYGPTVPAWREAAGPAGLFVLGESQFFPKGTAFKGPVFGSAADFSKNFEARFGYVPGYDDANSAACGLAFGLAIEKAGSLDPKKVRAALAGLDVMTFVGRLRFNADGSRADPPLYALQIVSKDPRAHPAFVFPKDAAEASIVHPRPPFDKR
jgi:branched-chain amino acid transport system substrate-binding protein